MKTREQISYNMSRVRSSGSKIEREMGKALWAAGLRYRKQYSTLPGRPDFAIVSAKIAVFCDSSFWHGRGWPATAKDLRTNRDFWILKIEKNIARDREVSKAIRKLGWLVLRFWDNQIEKDPQSCARKVQSAAIRRKENEKRKPAHHRG